MSGLFVNSNVSDAERREKLYDGELFVYNATPSTLALCEFARTLCEDAFAPYHPTEAQHHMPVEQYVEILAELKPKFIHHPEAKQQIQAMLKEFGCDMEKTYFDVPRLRTMTHDGYLTSGLGTAFPPHRDTWYSPPNCQIIWWLPVYEIESDSAMAFHPNYWNTPVKNSSADFNYQHWASKERTIAAKQVKTEARKYSAPIEEMELEPQTRIVTEPGGVTVFAGAQMHSTVPNTSGRTRLSIDIRVINLDDVIADRGAPNVDDESTGSSLGDYHRGIDLAPVPEEFVERHLEQKGSGTAL